MKRFLVLLCAAALILAGCGSPEPPAAIAATTLPVYEFTVRLCRSTDLTVTRLVTESVSCLHDYSLNVRQVKAAEAAEVVVISGAGLEEFMDDILTEKNCIDSSASVEILDCRHLHEHEGQEHAHHHEVDSHIWLSPKNAMTMARNICTQLCSVYPQYTAVFEKNLEGLLADLEELQRYGEETLSQLSCREIITFHDGFSYFAEAFDLTILEAMEEESGSEASARELTHLIGLVEEHDLPAIFIETNGSVSAADVIARETGVSIYTLDMAMSGDSYFDAMYHNIDTIKEALG